MSAEGVTLPSPRTGRLPLVDAIKAIASQLIVLHHLAFYGPMPEAVAAILPGLIAWLADHARIAVQAFLVVGGFLLARGLGLPDAIPLDARAVGTALARRYLRLAWPLTVAILLAIAAAALARHWMTDEATPGSPTWSQLLAHLALAQDLAGIEALSAGVWYVSIDFQLFALTLAALWLGQRIGAGSLPILCLAIASMFAFNRMPGWDVAAPYFFGAYALGLLAWSAHDRGRVPWPTLLVFSAAALALLVDFRPRLAVALCVATILAAWVRWAPATSASRLRWFGDISYALFLVHYPVLLVVNAFVARLVGSAPASNLFALVIAWGASLAAAAVFHRVIERRAPAARPSAQATAPAPG